MYHKNTIFLCAISVGMALFVLAMHGSVHAEAFSLNGGSSTPSVSNLSLTTGGSTSLQNITLDQGTQGQSSNTTTTHNIVFNQNNSTTTSTSINASQSQSGIVVVPHGSITVTIPTTQTGSAVMKPVVRTVQPQAIRSKQEFEIIGSYFGKEGSVYLDGKMQTVVQWSDTAIRVRAGEFTPSAYNLTVESRTSTQSAYSDPLSLVIVEPAVAPMVTQEKCTAETSKPEETKQCQAAQKDAQPSCAKDEWTCGAWSACQSNGLTKRECTKTLECPLVETEKPATQLFCFVPQAGDDKDIEEAFTRIDTSISPEDDERVENGERTSARVDILAKKVKNPNTEKELKKVIQQPKEQQKNLKKEIRRPGTQQKISAQKKQIIRKEKPKRKVLPKQ